MKVLFVAGEAFPLVKTGGLGDVAGALPKALTAMGDDVRLLIPAYRGLIGALEERGEPFSPGEVLGLACRLIPGRIPGGGPGVWALDCPEVYDRPGGPYLDPDGRDWSDNALRFALLARVAAVIGVGGGLMGWRPDVIHAHDWQAGLVPLYLRQWGGGRPKTVFTVHNLHYQGIFDPGILPRIEVDPRAYAIDGIEFYGRVSFLKAGLVYADRLTTVSPTYAREIQTASFGCGMDGLIRDRAGVLDGILNGIDTGVWNPALDPQIKKTYDGRNPAGKTACKAALQAEMGLDVDAKAPLVGLVGRLVWQKGIDLFLDALPGMLSLGFQVVVEGAGEPDLERRCREAAQPGRMAVRIGFDEALAHRTVAGCDLFAVPSRFEPCGLTQMCALRYGTLPVVRRTGGLADSVGDCSASPAGTGFVFTGDGPGDLLDALGRARALFAGRAAWAEVQARAMATDVGWGTAARAYREVYGKSLEQ